MGGGTGGGAQVKMWGGGNGRSRRHLDRSQLGSHLQANPSCDTTGFAPAATRYSRLDRSTARYIYKSKNGKLLVVLTQAQKAKRIFEQYIQSLFNKDLFLMIII